MSRIRHLNGLEILDSRGRPTVSAFCTLESGVMANASVPSGASTGCAEAIELRDGDSSRYLGLGCRKAVSNINTLIAQTIQSREIKNQNHLDQILIELDGTANKSRLGANAILAVSLAFARAQSQELQRPLHEHFSAMMGQNRIHIPQLTVNLFSGGKHAGGQIPIQDVLLVPINTRSVDEALAAIFSVYQSAMDLTKRKYGYRPLRADEGGLAPPFADVESMLGDATASILQAGFQPGSDIALAVDIASTHFFNDGIYDLGSRKLNSIQMIEVIDEWCSNYPIISVEDGLAEEDWDHWPQLRERLAGRAITLGDDLLCTNPGRIQRAIQTQSANALLLKVNQIGTLSEAQEAFRLAKSAGWHVTVSARSGETEDNWLADLAVGWGGDQIKVGSITQSERLAKYNRLLQIESEIRSNNSHWTMV